MINVLKSLMIPALVLVLMPFVTFGQDKLLTIEDASYMNYSLFPERLSNIGWMGDSDRIAYIDNNAVVSLKATSEKRDTLLKLDMLNAELSSMEKEEMKGFPRITWLDENTFTFTAKNTVYSFDLEEGMLMEINNFPEEAKNIRFDGDHENVAYTVDNNLFVAIRGRQVQITNDDNENIINGQSVHRNEFGISGGIFWSPQGKAIAFYRMDQTMVTDYPIVDINTRIAEVDNIKYPMAGMTSHEVTLGIYDLEKGTTVFMDTGEPADQYLTSVTWGPSGEYIYIALLNRDQNHLKLNKYEASTGEFLTTLFEEKDEEYVEPEHPLYFLNNNKDEFLWMSERDGYEHLYHYDTDGNLLERVTKGDWVVTRYLGTDSKDRNAYFMATKESPLERDLYSVELKSGEITRVTGRNGTHKIIPAKDYKYFIDVYSDTVTPAHYSVIDSKGKARQTLLESPDPLAEYELGECKIFELDADDGTILFSRMILPPDFDPEKRYPAIVYVYGGPHAQLVTNSWLGGARLFLYYLAQEGYIVFTLDNRGSANRGLEFEQSVFRNLGTLEVEDQMAGVKYLRSLPYVDPERIGVHGWSYGGFMTISLMLKQPDDFKVGVCGGPVTDWKYYEVMYGERYMDTPETNPEGYENSGLLDKAGNLEGKLLVIHGTHDPVVVWQHSLSLIEAFIKEGRQVDYFVYPGHGHGVGGKDRVHLNTKMSEYFFNNL
jgi:dipeptidyl-peptidase-4